MFSNSFELSWHHVRVVYSSHKIFSSEIACSMFVLSCLTVLLCIVSHATTLHISNMWVWLLYYVQKYSQTIVCCMIMYADMYMYNYINAILSIIKHITDPIFNSNFKHVWHFRCTCIFSFSFFKNLNNLKIYQPGYHGYDKSTLVAMSYITIN